jgi:hypothetical protein
LKTNHANEFPPSGVAFGAILLWMGFYTGLIACLISTAWIEAWMHLPAATISAWAGELRSAGWIPIGIGTIGLFFTLSGIHLASHRVPPTIPALFLNSLAVVLTFLVSLTGGGLW